MESTSTALPNEWVKRLFIRLQSMYGNRMETMWGGADPDDLRQAWGEELSRFGGEDLRDALAATLTVHRDYPPTLPQFVVLCQDARTRRAEKIVKISGPKTAMPDHIREQLRSFVKRATRAY